MSAGLNFVFYTGDPYAHKIKLLTANAAKQNMRLLSTYRARMMNVGKIEAKCFGRDDFNLANKVVVCEMKYVVVQKIPKVEKKQAAPVLSDFHYCARAMRCYNKMYDYLTFILNGKDDK